ncbi:DUF5941 domain-containing protein [Actinomadura macra]|uniref:DUF5941 domain-containing protein n=1 Tax=Actinomadura macra TaxID=46164 RepID=UPI000B1CDEF7|nr:DUF5941 domain-containing protein [Actinomadura macra]
MIRVLIIATGRTADAGPTAALPYGGGREAPSLLTRLCQRLDTLNVPDRHVVTRPELAPPLRKNARGAERLVARAAAGTGGTPAPALYAPVVVLLLAAPAAHPHARPMDWLVPPIIRGIEYGYLAVLGFAQGVSAPLVYVLIAVLALHHHDTVYRSRLGLRPQAWALRAGLGWEGRMLLAALAGLCGLLPFAYAALAAYLGVLFAGESVTTWARTGHDSGVMVDLEEEEA